MAVVTKPWMIEGASQNWGPTGLNKATECFGVGGVITQPDGTGRDPTVMGKARQAAGIPQPGQGHPSDPACIVVDADVEGKAGDQCVVKVHFERPSNNNGNFGAPLNIFVVEDDTTVQAVATQVVPKTKLPIRLLYDATGSNNTADRSSTITYLQPMRVLTLSAVISARPNAAVLNAISTVNDQPWQGLGRGMWLFAGFRSKVTAYNAQSPLTSQYEVSAQFWTKNSEDWSTYVFYTMPDGSAVKVAPGALTSLSGAPYALGVSRPSGANVGVIKVGPYDVSPFFTIFGV